MRLIDADALKERVCGDCPGNDCTPDATDTVYGCTLVDSIDQMPTIEPEVRHGRWIMLEPYGAHHTRRRKCSECGEIKAQELTNFCPDCGADMREVSEDAGTD